MAEAKTTTERGARKREPKAEPAPPAEETQAREHVCNVAFCPIGLALSTMQGAAPDVMEHLLKAGTELFLAFRAVVDSRADEAAGERPSGAPEKPSSLEKIDLG